MSKAIRRVALGATLALTLTAAPSAWAQRSLCNAGEAVIFACTTGAKAVALCATKPVKPGAPVRYLFGSPASIELSLPGASVTQGTTPLSGGGIDYLRVRNGAYDYVLYSGVGRSWEQDGFVVERTGRAVSSGVCKGPGLSDDSLTARDALRLPADRQAFRWPPQR